MEKTAASLGKGHSAKILRFNDERIASSLLRMGLMPGTSIKMVRTAPFGCPIYFTVRGQHLGLRREEAQAIVIDQAP